MKRAVLILGILLSSRIVMSVEIPAPDTVANPPDAAERSASGLAFVILEDGAGTAHPDPWDQVTVHYTGWTTDGAMFETTRGGDPATFLLNQVIPGWTEGLQLMVQGERRRFWIPVELAYNNQPGRPEGMLVFDIELLAIVDQPQPPGPRPPADALCSSSGLCSVILTEGDGDTHPGQESVVTLHFAGWQAPGVVFHSSRDAGSPITLPVDELIPGWSEGVQLMVQGEERRFWIPENLAYQGQQGMPAGMLVFDIELLEIK
jgi:FKBP-type peptidyl-prolyl cis-trans isomerase